MPAKGGYPATFKSPGIHVVSGQFTTAGASAPDPSFALGAGYTVSAPASGVYTITLTDGAFRNHTGILVSLADSSANATTGVRPGANSISTAGTFQIITSSAAGTDANLTGPVVSFCAILRNTSAQR